MKGFCLLFFCIVTPSFSEKAFCVSEKKADLEETLQQIAETTTPPSHLKNPQPAQTAVSGHSSLAASSASAAGTSSEKNAERTQASAPASHVSAPAPTIVLPENPKVFMETGDRSEIALSFHQENTDTLILKVNNGMILIRQKGKEFKVQIVGKDLQKTNVRAFKSRNGKALIIDSTAAASVMKKQRLDYLITIPEDVNLQCIGGKLDIKLENLKGTYVTLDCGHLIFRSVGSILSGVKATAGEANIWIDGITNQFLLACASGDVQVKYLSSPKNSTEGLSFSRKPMINLRQALGRSVFVFPEEMRVMYKSSSGVRASFPSERNADLRGIFYVSDLVDIQLIKSGSSVNSTESER